MTAFENCRMRSSPSTAGFTLMESVIGMGVLGITVAALYAGMTYGTRRTFFTREDERATQILVEKMEAIRLYRWDQIQSFADPDTGDDDPLTPFDADDPHLAEDEPSSFVMPTTFTASLVPGSTNSLDQIYSGTLVITNAPMTVEGYSNQIAQVTVSLTWQSSGKARTRSLTSFFARYGMQNNVPR
jgi:type II secretory pathway pseudopilin PulG